MVGENFGEFGESGAIRQSFTHQNLYRVDSMTNEYRANSKHAWKLLTISLLGLRSITTTAKDYKGHKDALYTKKF